MEQNQEYLIANGLGGFTSSTSLLGNTRKYHGLLVVSELNLERINILNRLEEKVTIEGNDIHLSANVFKDNVVSPEITGLTKFSLGVNPVWEFEFPQLKLRKSYTNVYSQNIFIARYEIAAKASCEFRVSPFLADRNMHAVKKLAADTKVTLETNEGLTVFTVDKHRFLRVMAPGSEYIDEQIVYKDFFYPLEQERGYDAYEDLLKAGTLRYNLPPGETIIEIVFEYFSDKPVKLKETDYFQERVERERKIVADFRKNNAVAECDLAELTAAQSDQFIIMRPEGVSVIAGYHWFDDWGRDTFLSFNGLLLLTGRFKEAKNLLLRWGKLEKDGLLPNRPYLNDYNSLDAVLWFGNAVGLYYRATMDKQTIKQLLPALENVISAFETGINGISLTAEGFLNNNNSQAALTWMDAQINGVPVTPRTGMAVEIQALWYNFLKTLNYLKLELSDTTFINRIRKITASLEKNFEVFFWNSRRNCFYDRIEMEYKDDKIRPNQIFCAYLPFSPVGKRKLKQMLSVCEHELLTTTGLKTLSGQDSDYHNSYHGDQQTRDQAYHQGTIWPFLLGMYLVAIYNTSASKKLAVGYIQNKLADLLAKIKADNIRYLPELYDPASGKPEGCISQAWSVATILESLALVKAL